MRSDIHELYSVVDQLFLLVSELVENSIGTTHNRGVQLELPARKVIKSTTIKVSYFSPVLNLILVFLETLQAFSSLVRLQSVRKWDNKSRVLQNQM